MLLNFLQNLCVIRTPFLSMTKFLGNIWFKRTNVCNQFFHNSPSLLHIAFKLQHFSEHEVNIVLNAHFTVLLKTFIIICLFIILISVSINASIDAIYFLFKYLLIDSIIQGVIHLWRPQKMTNFLTSPLPLPHHPQKWTIDLLFKK